MVKALIKLFSDVAQAEKALGELMAKGYTPDEIGILAVKQETIQKATAGKVGAKAGSLSGVGSIFGAGKVADAVAQADASAALAELWGLPAETIAYYGHGLAKGGMVISVQGDDARLANARTVLRAIATDTSQPASIEERKSGFQVFDRQTETNPVDRQLSGDFRKY